MILKNATFRHNENDERLCTATIYSDGGTTPSSPIDVGLLATDKFDVGSTVTDTTTGDVKMYGEDGNWHLW